MSKVEKLISKLLNLQGSFTLDELTTLLESDGFGFKLQNGSGSRMKFKKGNEVINFHKPHGSKDLPEYVRKQIIEKLKRERLI
jgi:predicted RNA binding protein YcfA (HicA-like mRNA interferase family)